MRAPVAACVTPQLLRPAINLLHPRLRGRGGEAATVGTLRRVLDACASLGDCAAAIVHAHRHGMARLGVLVAHLLDQSGVFGVWSTVALGGRGHALRSLTSPGLRAAERGTDRGVTTAQRETVRVAAADCRALIAVLGALRGVKYFSAANSSVLTLSTRVASVRGARVHAHELTPLMRTTCGLVFECKLEVLSQRSRLLSL